MVTTRSTSFTAPVQAIELALGTKSDLSLRKLVEFALDRQGGAYNYTQRYFGSEELAFILSNIDFFPVTLDFLLG